MHHRLKHVERLQPRLFYWAIIALVVGVQLWRGELTNNRWFCVDEFEHLHASWCMGQGMVPYRDFFEHHTPLLYLLLAPVMKLMRPETSYEAAIHTILISRWLMWGLAALILWLIYRLGREVHGRAVGAMAVIFTLSTMMFVDRSTEIRPDMLSVPAMLGALVLATRAMRKPDGRGATHLLAISGVVAGFGILASPKSVFWGIGFALALIWAVTHRRWKGHRRKMLAVSVGGALAPMAITLIIMAALGAAGDLIHNNFVLNSQWKFRLDPWEKIGELAYESPFLAAFGFIGLLGAVVECIGLGPAKRARLLPAAALASLIVGIFVIPVPYTEYFMMPITLLAIYEAAVIVRVISLLRRALSIRTNWQMQLIPLAISSASIAALAYVLSRHRPPVIESWRELAAWIGALCIVAVVSVFRWRHVAMLVLLGMMILFPLRRFETLFPKSPETNLQVAQRAALAFVHEHSTPTDTVFDGWDKITAPFRPHAWYYFFLHREIRPLVSTERWRELQQGLEGGKIRPKLVVMDKDTRELPPEIVQWFEQHYQPADGAIWVRRN